MQKRYFSPLNKFCPPKKFFPLKNFLWMPMNQLVTTCFVNTDKTIDTGILILNDGLAGHTTHGGGDRRIPLLRQVYEQFPNMPINVDIKVDSTELIQKVPKSSEKFRIRPRKSCLSILICNHDLLLNAYSLLAAHITGLLCMCNVR